MVVSSGSTRLNIAWSPPTSTVISPELARCTPPVTGHSSTWMPRCVAAASRRCRSSMSVVLISTQMPPRGRLSKTPPGPSTTWREMAGEGRAVITTSALRQTPAMSSDHWAPACSRRRARSLFRSVTVTAKPALTRLLHRPSPSAPRPIKPMRSCCMFVMVCLGG